MSLLVTYIAMTVVGTGVIYVIGLGIEMAWPAASLPVFLFSYFVMLWGAWVVAVKVTAPKSEALS